MPAQKVKQNSRTENSIFRRNLEFSINLIAAERTRDVLKVLSEQFPFVTDFKQLRALGGAVVANQYKPLKRVEIPSSVDPAKLKTDVAMRFVDGFFYLQQDEELVFSGDKTHGPYKQWEVNFMAKRIGAMSLTNDEAGHILDPEEAETDVTTSSSDQHI
jgi:hypothetical protein